MSTLRSLRLLNAVEAGTVDSAALQTFLLDSGRASELSVLLVSRGHGRRMAASPLTVSTLAGSQIAREIIFASATADAAQACEAIVSSAIAMNAVAFNTASLNVVAFNPIAWNLFTKSAYYELNAKKIIANLAGVEDSDYATVTLLIGDPDAMANVAASPNAMQAVVASLP
jgi:hypothetical protein